MRLAKRVGRGELSRIVWASLCLLVAAAGGAVLAYALYRTIEGPWKAPYDPGIHWVNSLQWLGATCFILPVAAVAGCLAAAGVLLMRRPRELGTARLDVQTTAAGVPGEPIAPPEGADAGAGLSPAPPRMQRWVARARSGTTAGYLPALVVLALVSCADQLLGHAVNEYGDTSTSAIAAGGAVGFAAFLVAWGVARRRLHKPVWPSLARLVLTSSVVAAVLSCSSFTRAEDNQNLALYARLPLAAGFHNVSAAAVPAVREALVKCANSEDCVATGTAAYYGSDPWADWPLLGISVNGGTTWQTWAVSSDSPGSLSGPATCSADRCDVPMSGDPNPKFTGAIVDFAHGTATVAPTEEVMKPANAVACVGRHCVSFVVKDLAKPPGGLLPPSAGQKVPVSFASYSADGGRTWTDVLLPVPHRLPGAARGTSVVNAAEGPWCQDAMHCAGAITVEARSCLSSLFPDVTPCRARLTMLYTDDGGRTWSARTFPVAKPDVSYIRCSTPTVCFGESLANGAFVISNDEGRTWAVHAPTEAQDIECWGVNSCIGASGKSYMLATADGGRTWLEQRVPGAPAIEGFPAWCNARGRCLANAYSGQFAEGVIVRAGPLSPWVVHRFPAPRLLHLS